MGVCSIGTYRPVWEDGRRRVAGPDEDLVTMAVAAGRAAVQDSEVVVARLVLVTLDPDVVEGLATAVIRLALDLGPGVPIEYRLGGGPAALEALADAAPGTLLISVANRADAAAVAAVVGTDGVQIEAVGVADRSLPMRVHWAGEASMSTYVDARVERELGWVPALRELTGDGELFLSGVSARDASRFGATTFDAATADGAAGPLMVLAAMVEKSAHGRLIALDGATAAAVDVGEGTAAVRHDRGAAVPVRQRPLTPAEAGEVAFSMPAHARAVESRVGLVAARCVCGTVSYPPRVHCLGCGRQSETEPYRLGRTGAVYSVVTVWTAVPGVAGPYAIAIVAIDDSPVRVSVKVADASGSAIGERGELVLRRVAVREGVPDYAYAFRPHSVTEERV